MNRTLITIIAVVLVVAAVVALVFFMMRKPEMPTQPNNPFGGLNPSNTPGGSTSQTGLAVETTEGTTVFVPDFTAGHPAEEQPSGTYYSVTADADYREQYSDFAIVYGTDSTFAIGLTDEPLGEARLHAEQKLRELTQLSDTDLCSLNTTVMASPRVNEQYAGVNLGLSFCPGAVALP